MGFYIYDNHTGGLYWTDTEETDTYCDTCGDSDRLMGYAKNKGEAYRLALKSGYYSGYLKEFVNSIPFERVEK